MLLMGEKGIRVGKCHSIYQYAKANNKYMKDYDKMNELSYIHAMSQTLPVINFKFMKDTSQSN